MCLYSSQVHMTFVRQKCVIFLWTPNIFFTIISDTACVLEEQAARGAAEERKERRKRRETMTFPHQRH